MKSTMENTEQDHLQQYLARAYNFPMLSRDCEVELATKMREGGRIGERAREQLVNAHLKLVVAMARKMGRMGGRASLDDLIQEGNIGLLQAADKFEVERGFRFATYAWHWVRQAMSLYSSNDTGVIRVPVNKAREVRKLKDAVKRLERQCKLVTDEVLAVELGISVKDVRELFESMLSECSLNVTIGDGETELGAMLEDTSAPNALEVAIAEDGKRVLRDAIKTLSEREAEIVSLRFGLDGEGERTLEEVSLRFGVTRERIRQIEVKALEKLRKVKRVVQL